MMAVMAETCSIRVQKLVVFTVNQLLCV